MKYQPITCVWEVTMGCNMRCGHCGSSCEQPLPDELTTDEALSLCDQIAELGLKWITLSGGEPLTRKDIALLVERLTQKGVAVNLITNGWLLTGEKAEELKQSKIATVAISIDGTEKIHDEIRKEGAFEHARKAFAILKEMGIRTGAITTITNRNLGILGEIKEELIRMGVHSWQVQLGLPMGNLKEKPDWLLAPEHVKEIIDFCCQTALEGRIKIYPADCIGYYTKKEMEIKRFSYETDMISVWDGCNAGIRGFGILHNGDILGCTSIRDKKYIEGSIRERALREIWEDTEAFGWRRKMKKEELAGDCQTCVYGERCLGGCPNTRLTMNGDIYSENLYCAYNLKLKEMCRIYEEQTDPDKLFETADILIRQGMYQEAVIALKRAGKLKSEDVRILVARAYAEYMCGNYEQSREDNYKALLLEPKNQDALGGYAISLFKAGKKEEGIQRMRELAGLPGAEEKGFVSDLRAMEAAR